MRINIILTLAVLFLAASLFCYCGGSENIGLGSYMPGNNEVSGWEKDEETRIFIGEDLWEHINGGAEVYHEYGFKQVGVQDYKNESGKSIIVEFFEMNSPGGAYGIYSFKTGDSGEILETKAEGLFEDYYLNFWKGNILVTITGFDSDNETVTGLKNIAKAIDSKMDFSGDHPEIVSKLPADGLNPLSVKYYTGNLGIYNKYAFTSENIFGFKEAVAGDYDSGYSVYVMSYSSDTEFEEAFSRVKEKLSGSDRFSDFEDSGNYFLLRDRDNMLIYITGAKGHIIIVTGASDESASNNIVSQIQ
ncbi:DUF6599 family protein [candidate division KSB1 bacterium]